MHSVRPAAAAVTRAGTLPPDLAAMFLAPEFWTMRGQNSAATVLV